MTPTGGVLFFRAAEKDILVLVRIGDRLVLLPRGSDKASTTKR